MRTDRPRLAPERQRGFALVTVLWMVAVLAMLAAAFLTMLESDRRLAARARAESEALLLARGGLEAYQAGSVMPELAPGEPYLFKPDPARPTHFVEVERIQATPVRVEFRATVSRADGTVLARRTLVVPEEDMERWYEAR